jgi:bifunctional non-homologous end joining protein LigD
MTLDLDPGPGVRWPRIVEAAKTIRALLEGLGLRSFVKTTGGAGLHVVVPLTPRHPWASVRAFSRAVALEMVRRSPREYTATLSKSQRTGKIFVDYLRNSRGATAVAAYSPHARKRGARGHPGGLARAPGPASPGPL